MRQTVKRSNSIDPGGIVMRNIGIFLAVLVLVIAPAFQLFGGTLAGVTLPDTVQAGGKKLVLNGLGLRKKYMVKVYVAGLYLEQKSSDPAAILKPDASKRIVMHFVRGVTKNQIVDGFSESFEDNTPDAKQTMKAEIDQFLSAIDSVHDSDELLLTYLPGTGTTVAINSKEKVTISAPAFAPVLFSVWLGPTPQSQEMKEGLLGR
jgi:Chalcone isomerase-like